MGDGLKISKDKRHRSSSSLSGVLLEGTRSDRKIELRATIPEGDDQFALAEAKCDDLQEKIDLVKVLKRKKKLKKRSMTRVMESPTLENLPFISVRTQPKKSLLVTEVLAERRQPERRPYADSDTLEQHRMLGQVFRGPNAERQQTAEKSKGPRRARADGDVPCDHRIENASHEVACGVDDQDEFDYEYDSRFNDNFTGVNNIKVKSTKDRNQPTRRRHVPKETAAPGSVVWKEKDADVHGGAKARQTTNKQFFNNERELIEAEEQSTGPLEASIKEKEHHNRRIRYRARRYELPTVSSQMKQTVARTLPYAALPPHNIPFIVSKSTEPSHNVGVNLQQVLNGLKIQQPLSKIPLTIAHHMGLGHLPAFGARSITNRPAVGGGCMNAIWVNGRVLRVPSRRCVSYSRLLALYREGDGIVPRFLRAMARPHYFYTSMYNLPTHREDFDGATSKANGGSEATKKSLQEYANLYRQFERVEKSLAESPDPELERRRDELARQLAAREEHIRTVVKEYKLAGEEGAALRASASAANEAYHHSSFHLHEDLH